MSRLYERGSEERRVSASKDSSGRVRERSTTARATVRAASRKSKTTVRDTFAAEMRIR